MAKKTCESCRTACEPGFVSVTYVGAERPLWVRLNQVPAAVCPQCHIASVGPEMARHLNELGLVVQQQLGAIRTRPVLKPADKAA
jgi:hypothetical protein